MTFKLYRLRFRFLARDSLHFPPGMTANTLRGAFGNLFRRIACTADCPGAKTCMRAGSCAYARMFEPSAIRPGPSGLKDWPRPFVFRAAHLDGSTVASGETFYFDVNVFDVQQPVASAFVDAFALVANEGLGPGRGRAVLQSVCSRDADDHENPIVRAMQLDLKPSDELVENIDVSFLSPTELKSGDGLAARPEFPVLFARCRDRVSTLRALYGPGPLEIDFRAMGDAAEQIVMTHCDLQPFEVMRRSSRTGQIHSLGGFVGTASYSGDLRPFLPILRAAEWTGVGRQTVWGKGAIAVTAR